MKIGICVDSVACLSKEKIEINDFGLVYLHVNSDEKSYVEYEDLNVEQFFQLKSEGIKLKSSQPSPEAFKVEYEKMRDRGYTDIISIHPTNIMSGTVNSARLGSELAEGINVHIFEGNCAAFELELQIDLATKLINDGLEVEAIISQLSQMKSITENYLVIEDMLVLAESGRINKTIAKIGNLVKLKPMLKLDPDTGFTLAHKYRTMKKVLDQTTNDILNYARKHGATNVNVTNIANDEFCSDLINNLKVNNKIHVNICGPIGPVLHVNFGKKGLGICWSKA